MPTPPRILFTPGEPAGIGPDLAISLAQQPLAAELVIIGDQDLLAQRAEQLDQKIHIRPYEQQNNNSEPGRNELTVLHVPLNKPAQPGKLNAENSAYVLNTLDRATKLCLQGEAQALVTGPVHKGIINQAGISFTGHTEYLAEQSQASQVVMMLACEGLRVALATTHIPLAEVSRSITQDKLESIIRVLYQDLQHKFAITQPRILVCGLNPHAGEDGHLGREEIDTIIPVLEKLRLEGLLLTGPLPADSLFTPDNLTTTDAVLSMYHDQGLPVLKHMGFGQAVNITLGLPFIRTSVDHGTALELAGSGQVNAGSLIYAIETAITLANKQT